MLFLRSELWDPQRKSYSFKIPHISFLPSLPGKGHPEIQSSSDSTCHQRQGIWALCPFDLFTLYPFLTRLCNSSSCCYLCHSPPSSSPPPRADRPHSLEINAASSSFQRRFKKLPFGGVHHWLLFTSPVAPPTQFKSFLGFPIVHLHGTF